MTTSTTTTPEGAGAKAAPAATPKPRQTLYIAGRRGDRVRALVDKARDRVEVHYRDLDGVPHKQVFPNTKAGRADAVAWATTFHAERERMRQEASQPKAAPRTTLRQLWDAFRASPAWRDLREKTRVAYEYRWRKWELHVGRHTVVDETTLKHVDDFITAGRAADVAVNQIRQVINVARGIYNWGQSRKLVAVNDLALYRWKKPKDAQVHEPEEYTEAEFDRLLGVLSPQQGGTWRPWVGLMLAGFHGQRANAVLHLRWEDIDHTRGEIRWPAAYQKQGVELVQPLTWEAVAALETARTWRERTGYTGPWILFAGGGNKRLGPALVGNARHYRKDRTPAQDTAWTYQAFWRALNKAEVRAHVAHKPYRAIHGFRKMNAGNVADRTGDARLGMEWIGDRDLKQAPKYLKRRSERMDRAAAAATGSVTASRETVPESSPNANATRGGGVEG